MTVKELITELEALHPRYNDTDIGILFDGADRMDLDNVYIANSGRLIVTGGEEHAIFDADEPSEWICPTCDTVIARLPEGVTFNITDPIIKVK